MSKRSTSKPRSSSGSQALHRLFVKQKPKVNENQKVSRVLKTFAEDDYKRIAQLIQGWLKRDERH